MIPQPPRATLTCTLFPDTSLFRSAGGLFPHDRHRAALVLAAAGLDRPAGGLGSGPMNCVVVTEAGKMAGQGASAGHSSAMDQSSNAVPALSRPALRVSPCMSVAASQRLDGATSGRASGRERVSLYGWIPGGAGY